MVAPVPVIITAAIASAAPAAHADRVAAARVLMVGIPLAVGLWAWYLGRDTRFGLMLGAAGLACFVTTFAESPDTLPYTIGRGAGWLVEVFLVYLLLSFPTGRLATRADRILTAAMALVALVLFLPRLLLAEHFEVPSPYTNCVHDCPANAAFALAHQPAFVNGIMRPLGAFAVLAVTVAVIARVRRRMANETRLGRQVLAPVLVVGILRLGLLGFAITARYLDPALGGLREAAWLLALAIPALALAFFVGLLSWYVFAGRALQGLAGSIASTSDAPTVRRALAEALHDPALRIDFPSASDADGWLDGDGRPVALPANGDGRAITEVHRGDPVIARIIHDDVLLSDPAFLAAAVAIASVALDNERLTAQSEATSRELRQSRARIAASAASERRRIERNLHDGAQQQLVALRIELELTEDIVRHDAEEGIAHLRELEERVEEALEDLRSLAHGVYPPLLADLGLEKALRAAATRSTVKVEFEVLDLPRYSPELEGAVYFCMLEALQNAQKHAPAARRIVMSLDGGTPSELRFGVRDDGDGAPGGEIVPGAGITNMRDRLAAVGGTVELASTPHVGTVLRGRVPTSAAVG